LTLLLDGGPLQWLLDFDVSNNDCDKIEIGMFANPGDKPLEIIGYSILGESTEKEYTFQIINIGGGDPYPQINVTNPLCATSNGVYALNSSGQRDGCVIMKLLHPWNLLQKTEINEIYIPTHLTHLAALSNISNIFDIVYDGEAHLQTTIPNSQYRVWNRSTTYDYGFDISGKSLSLNGRGNATVFGVDGKPFLLKGGSMFVSSVFAGCAQEDFRYTIGSHNNSSIGGLKLLWLNKDYGRFSLICSCGGVKTSNSDCKIRSHVVFLSSHYGHSLPLRDDLSIIPVAQFDYSAVSFKDAKTKNVQVKHEALHSLKASAGINLQLNVSGLTFSVGSRLSTKFSAENFGKFKDLDIDSPTKISNSYVEFGTKISGKIYDVAVDLAFGKSCGERNGSALNLVLSRAL
jgi:hypothetical protein